MSEKEKDFVREYNASVKHGEATDKVTMPRGITVKTKVRRTQSGEKRKYESEKKEKGIRFGLTGTVTTTNTTMMMNDGHPSLRNQ